jgi:hypothetical protein
MLRRFLSRFMSSVPMILFSASAMFVAVSDAHGATCYDPALEDGSAFMDSTRRALVVVRKAPGGNDSDTIVGIGVGGKYYGCRAEGRAFVQQGKGNRKVSVFLPLQKASVTGFEIDVSVAVHRILAGRAIQVPWEVVDRSKGVTATCTDSTAVAFESFLYQVLRDLHVRRCTGREIEELIGGARKKAS